MAYAASGRPAPRYELVGVVLVTYEREVYCTLRDAIHARRHHHRHHRQPGTDVGIGAAVLVDVMCRPTM